ncbi:GlxA family transcriptional regulator [Oxalobacteraceae bacterium A2-2]
MSKSVAFIVFPGFQVVDMAAVTVFEMANTLPGGPVYDILMVSEHGGPVRSSAGIAVDTLPLAQFEGQAFDTVVLFGASDEDIDCTPGLVDLLRIHGAQARRTATICTGALLMARTGLLEGRRVTTHWAAARGLQRNHPKIRVEEDRIFINDGKFWSSAGMTACIDLGLALVEQDLGVQASRMIAKKMVVYHRRSGGQSQFSALLELEPKSDRIQTALSYAKQNLRRELSVDELADAANLSRRQFTRAFRLETGQSPAKAVETLRVEAARYMIESSAHSIEVVARETGFTDTERMRRAFLRAFGMPPQAIKRAARLQLA